MSSDEETSTPPTQRTNGYENGINGGRGGESDSDEDMEMPELPPIKVRNEGQRAVTHWTRSPVTFMPANHYRVHLIRST
jgi:hypothetical protein